ncbi:solute carrier organic anion transporter family member 4A1-like [Crassostrea virginica]|uniref:Solute carrier organic anion transporter family member n=1 Tax=Crassostrea virginica TaxID=6565 RepID=A0A8B8DB71_CRAVI|nr:solute carrier organic anion transporter family member 4A1-like [Crassostrea virginica]XP_022324181.1 solute carrier organic anion transporter family member 4A1-like [Crassostrea virginica]XP_022324182.1 solute carrier organic anion transporter family member 4A1-like [Crassostrea virginica]
MNNLRDIFGSQDEKSNIWGSSYLKLDSGKELHNVGTQYPDPDSEDESEAEIIEDEEWEKKHLRYGWGKFTPDCLQVFNSIRWYVFFTCVFSLFQGYLVNGVINAIISTLEKRFELPSSKSGLIVSSNDFIAFFLVLFISFYGGERHKPRLIGIGIITLGIGSFIFSLPHFLAGSYSVSGDLGDFENACYVNATSNTCSAGQTESSVQKYLYVFMLANALHGAGSTPMFTLGTTYIDNNTKAKNTSFYLGLIYAAASLGVAAGYMLGAQTLSIYTDFDKVDPEDLNLSPIDPRWVGAWWINFLIVGCVMMLITVPVLGFPKRLPGSKKLLEEREEEAYVSANTESDDPTQKPGWREFPRMLIALLMNPTFLFLALATCTEGMIVSGIAAFGAKFFQEKFNLPAAFAGLLMGIVTVPGAGGGMLLGGLLVKKLKLRVRGIIRMDLIVAIIALIFGCMFFIQCPKVQMAGVTSHYISKGDFGDMDSNLTGSCNALCHCSSKSYEPVCGMDGLIYFSPCHAGCSEDYKWMEGPMGKFKAYSNCSCVQNSFAYQFMMANMSKVMDTTTTATTVMSSTASSNQTNATAMPNAFQGICPSDCKLIWVVVPLLFIGMLMTFSTVSPTQTATLRCVAAKQKTLAIGVQWLVLRLLGTTPGPLILGSIIDSACRVWQEVCSETGSCWVYEKTDMGVKMFIWWCLTKSLSVLFYFCAQYFYKPAEKIVSDDDEDMPSIKPYDFVDAKESVI